MNCDIKSQNILYKDQIAVVDFGLCQKLEDNEQVISDRYLLQTRSYRSPASVLQAPLTLRDDLWSVGCVLFELYTQEKLFRTLGEDNYDTVNEYLQMIIETLGSFPPKNMLQQSNKLSYFFNVSKKANGEIDEVSLMKPVKLETSLLSIRKRMLAAAKMRGKFVDDKTDTTTGDDEKLLKLVEKLVSYADITAQDASLLW